ncbi:uncharacterized protein LOC121099615 [Falco naumanni]|uniref:uncharacterized protein LOC121099615 n=1 Tax=Falco naumanni TaxID=148594 RepID=UPI001ADE106B|nr:uncharacterized protein LOC121099615 [Falco naumanni]
MGRWRLRASVSPSGRTGQGRQVKGEGVSICTPPRRIGGWWCTLVCMAFWGARPPLGCTAPGQAQHPGVRIRVRGSGGCSMAGCAAIRGAQQFGVCSNSGGTCCMAGCAAIRGAEQLFGVHSTPRRAAWRGAQPLFGVHSNLGCTTLRSAPTSRSRTPRGCTAFWGAQHLKAQHPVGCTAPWGAQRLALWGVSGCTTPRGAWHQGGAGPFGVHGASSCAAPRGAEPVGEHSTPGCCRPLAPQGATAPTLCLILGCSRAPPVPGTAPPQLGAPRHHPRVLPAFVRPLGCLVGADPDPPPPPPALDGWWGALLRFGVQWGGVSQNCHLFLFLSSFLKVVFFFS